MGLDAFAVHVLGVNRKSKIIAKRIGVYRQASARRVAQWVLSPTHGVGVVEPIDV